MVNELPLLRSLYPQGATGYNPSTFPRVAATLIIMLLALIGESAPQITRIEQFYPNVATMTPYTFDATSTNGFLIKDFLTYVHGEYSAASPAIRAMRKDSTVIQASAINAVNSRSLNFYNNRMVSFGSMASIIQYKFDYLFPNFFTLETTFATNHNLDFYMATVDKSSGMHFLSTLTTNILYKYSDVALSTAAGSQTIADAPAIRVLNFMMTDKLIIAGLNSKVKILDKVSLAEQLSYVTTCSASVPIINAFYDGVHLPQTELRLDLACDSVLSRFSIDSATMSKIAELGPFTSAITNLIEFNLHNYLVVTYDTNIEIIKRSSYLATQSVRQLGISSVSTSSIACCDENKHKFTFTALTAASPPAFRSFIINLDFCSSYDGDTCIECNTGYRLSSTRENNTCVTSDEYPPRYGAKGSLITECKDSNCDRCIEAFYKCEVCRDPYFINMESFECSDLTTIQQFGRDKTNASIIRQCTDINCLYCKDDFTICSLCQEEYFNLSAGTCVAKNDKLAIEKSWFNESESKGYIQFSEGFTANPSQLLPQNLTFEVLDNQGFSYTDFKDFSVTGDPSSGLLIISLTLQTSIYGGMIKFMQIARTPIFYNQFSYMPLAVELNITNVRQIIASKYFMIQGVEKILQFSVWGTMTLSTIVGSIYNPVLGTLLMRSVSMLNLFSHLDGPTLHSADLLMDIVGKASVPLQMIEDLIRTPEEKLECMPSANFRKRYKGYASCNILDWYGKSLMLASLAFLIGLLLSMIAYKKHKTIREQLSKNYRHPVTKSILRFLVFSKWYGARFVASLVYATSPIVLQYSFLTMLSSGTPLHAVIFACFAVLFYFLFTFVTFRFIYFLLDLLHTYDLRVPANTPTKQGTIEELANKGDQKTTTKNINIVLPKKIVTSKDGKMKIKTSNNELQSEEETKNQSALMDSTLLDSANLARLDAPTAKVRLQTEIHRHIFSFVYFFVADYKTDKTRFRILFFYLPLVDLLSTLLSSYVLVRFAGDGVVQVYIITVFELLVFVALVASQPYASKSHYFCMVAYRLLLCCVLLLKLFNFMVMSEEHSRQRIVDTVTLAMVICTVMFAAVVGIYSVVKAITMLFKFKDVVAFEESLVEQERAQIMEKMGIDPLLNWQQESPQKEESAESKSVSGLSDSPVKRDLPWLNVYEDKINGSNKRSVRNRRKIYADNQKLIKRDLIKEDVDGDIRDNQVDEIKISQRPVRERPAPFVEMVEMTKRELGIFTTVNVTGKSKKLPDLRVLPKHMIQVFDGQFLTSQPVLSSSNYKGIQYHSRFMPSVTISQHKKTDKTDIQPEITKQPDDGKLL